MGEPIEVIMVTEDEVRVTTIQACDTCGHLACVCNIRAQHNEDCRFRTAATCAIPIECPHGRDVCPICDPCTCPRDHSGDLKDG